MCVYLYIYIYIITHRKTLLYKKAQGSTVSGKSSHPDYVFLLKSFEGCAKIIPYL